MRLGGTIWAARRVAGSFGPVLEGWAAVSMAFLLIGNYGMSGKIPIDIAMWREELGWFGHQFAYWSVFLFLGAAGLFTLLPVALYLRLREASLGKPDADT